MGTLGSVVVVHVGDVHGPQLGQFQILSMAEPCGWWARLVVPAVGRECPQFVRVLGSNERGWRTPKRAVA